eukprot:TRINITY_DN10977_c0_g1_i5.p1 TRINITY_DN10977_c0_g1~~TRINITY_DN10977_c0_g1_i5.p1  ORF type:complete len:922 (+),score=356.64 TRINITY_DN10977_c0_g1_i5:240-2768(+)
MVLVLDRSCLDWVLPVIVARMANDHGEDEDFVQMPLLDAVNATLKAFSNDITPRIDSYAQILVRCLRIADPDIKILLCTTIHLLCDACLKDTKSVALNIAKAMKPNLCSGRWAVRQASVLAFGRLLANGGLEIVYDFRDEVNEINTTRSIMKSLTLDRNGKVREATLDVMSDLTTEITERTDMHRHFVPLVLLALTDKFPGVRDKAREILKGLGAFYEMDNEDNRIGLENRRITLKDIQWYAEDKYPDMTMQMKSAMPGVDFAQRPPLGVRLAVAECCRSFIPPLLKDITALAWTIPNSEISRREAAMRTLMMTLWFIESNALQFMQAILDALYKILRDDDVSMKNEAFVCLELLGKLHTPENYIPLVLTQGSDEGGQMKIQEMETTDDIERREVCRRNMTIFSTTANTTKVNILIAFRYLLMGTQDLSEEQAFVIIQAVTSPDVVEMEAPQQLDALLDLLATLHDLFLKFGLVKKYSTGDAQVHADPQAELAAPATLDFYLFWTLNDVQACVDVNVQKKASQAMSALSEALTGSPNELYVTHFIRAISDKNNVPLAVFAKLLENGGHMLSQHTTDIIEIFLAHLHNVRYDVDVRDKLKCMNLLNDFILNVGTNKVTLEPHHLEQLLLMVVIPHGKWHVGGAAHLFRKVALSCLSALLVQDLFPLSMWAPDVDDPHSEEGRKQRDEARGLLTSTVDTWRNSLDADDAELRLLVVKMTRWVMRMPLLETDAAENIKELLLRLDDSNDIVRTQTAIAFRQIFEDINGGGGSNEEVKKACSEVHVSPWVSTLLLHMDDANQELKEAVCMSLIEVKKSYPDLVKRHAQEVRQKHMTTRLIDKLLEA